MQIRELSVPGALEFTPTQHRDDRGVFVEWFSPEVFEKAVGHSLRLAQGNLSVNVRGALRGIHFADVPPGQAKYVTCVAGALLDVVVDIRVGSPTFGQWDAVRLDTVDRRTVYVAEGLGHAFMALTADTAISYVCSEGYNPGREHGVHPMDPAIGIEWPVDVRPVLSAKDGDAPTLAQAEKQGLLPSYDDCCARYAALASSVTPAP